MIKYKKILLLLFILLSSDKIFSQDNPAYSFDFESQYRSDQLQAPWPKWGMNNYNIILDTTVKHFGKTSLLIEQSEPGEEGSFGCYYYFIPAVYKGREIEVRAFMKFENISNSPIGLLLRIDGISGTLEFDNMMQENIRGTLDWDMYSVKLPLPEEATGIYIGAINSGTGKLWVDDFELLIDGKPFEQAPPKN
ncbi:hypothetical protein BH10BAC5_BH10BAC5_22700 [soil metagenome]